MKIYIPNCSQKFRVRRRFDVAKKVKIEIAVEVAVSSYRPLSTRKVAFDDAIFQVENSDRAEATEAAI